MITYKKLIGEGITDSNGECSVGYVGKDEATLNIKAEAVNLTATTHIQVNYGLLLTSNKKIIQTGETATLTAKIPPKQGVIIENQTVYLSKIIDDSDLSLELTASTNIIQAGNNLTLTAKVTDSNNNIENIIVNLFKESDSMAKELVATLVTDSNGEASYNYVGVGAGKIDFSAESGILSSETYTIEDCDYYADSTKISDWSNVSSGGTAFKKSTYAIGLTNYSVEIQFNTINAQIIVGSESNWVAGVSFVSSPYYLYTHSSSGGTVTDVISSPTASDIWRLEIEGTTIRLYRNDNLYTTKTNCKVDYPTNLRLYPQNKSSSVDYVKIKPL